MTELPDDYLEHYGIKGMRWGRRRTREELAARRTELQTRSVATKKKVGQAQVRQNKAMQKVVVAKRPKNRHRRKLKRRLSQTNRAIRKDARVNRHIRKIDRKISRMDEETRKAGAKAIADMLANAED